MTGKEPVAEDAGLRNQEQIFMVLQQRIPETHSATPKEHQWHDAPRDAVDVTKDNVTEALQTAAELLADRPVRGDTIYRVVLRTRTIAERMIRL